ncbi:MAG: polysaccharide deacetylase family protein [Promethearchaeota archaeon]
MYHHLTIDLESWVHRSALQELTSEKRKSLDNGFIVQATSQILEILSKKKTNLTFFIVSEIYQWYPELIKQIKQLKHEIGFHTCNHLKLMGKNALDLELKFAEEFLSTFKPKGFRAPEMQLTIEECQLLVDAGFKYDSSIYSTKNILKNQFPILEIPVSSYRMINKIKERRKMVDMPRGLINVFLKNFEIPYGSGFFIGLIGDQIFRFIRHRESQGLASVMFLHPWQIYPAPLTFQEIKAGFPLSVFMFPYYINRRVTFEKIVSSLLISPLGSIIK